MNPSVFIEFGTNGRKIGRVKIALHEDIVPKTVRNFVECIKTKYKGNKVHRIIPGFMAQMGDFTRNDGTGGSSIYGEKFPDENFELKHDHAGILAMANSGPDTNGSQFYITFAETHWLNDKHVVFGKVTDGMDILKRLESLGRENGKPKQPVHIMDCGFV